MHEIEFILIADSCDSLVFSGQIATLRNVITNWVKRLPIFDALPLLAAIILVTVGLSHDLAAETLGT